MNQILIVVEKITPKSGVTDALALLAELAVSLVSHVPQKYLAN